MEVSVGGRSNNCKASLTAEADPLCKGTAVMVVCGGESAIPTGVVCASFIGVGCLHVEAIKTDWADKPRRTSVHLEPVASEGGWE